MKTKVVLALSGGLDSATTLALALEEGWDVHPVLFLYGQVHHRELDAAIDICNHYNLTAHAVELHLEEVSLAKKGFVAPPLSTVVGHPQPSTYVPFRNLIFASNLFHLAEVIEAQHVGFGFHKSDTYGYWDTTPHFVGLLENLARLNRKVIITPWTPFIFQTKKDIASEAVRLKVPIHLTYSCYRGGPSHCRECATCIERFTALEAVGWKGGK